MIRAGRMGRTDVIEAIASQSLPMLEESTNQVDSQVGRNCGAGPVDEPAMRWPPAIEVTSKGEQERPLQRNFE